MSGNSERLVLAKSRKVFGKSCPHCQKSWGYNFTNPAGGASILISWRDGEDIYYVNHYDNRVTYNSFTKREIRCSNCWEFITDERMKNMLIMMVKKMNRRWRVEYYKEFGVDQL